MQKNRLITLPGALALIGLILLCSSAGWARRDINAEARKAKASALVGLSAANDETAKLASFMASGRARRLNPSDTTTMLWNNMQRLFSIAGTKENYDGQLALVLENPSVAIDYYPSLIVLAHIHEPGDTLLAYRLARLAHSRHPENTFIGQYALNRGIDVVRNARFNSEGDTLPLTPGRRSFARSLTLYADSLIVQYGRNTGVDMAKAQLFYILGDTMALRNLADKMYLQDAEDPEILNNLTNIFAAIDDTSRVFELGLKSIGLEPAREPVEKMFAVANHSNDLIRLQSKVMDIVQNTMLEPEVRAEVLNGSVAGTLHRNMDLTASLYGLNRHENVPTFELDSLFLNRVDSMSREMIAEEPENYGLAAYLSDIGRGHAWLTGYGHRYLIEYAAQHPAATADNTLSVQKMVENGVFPDGMRDELYTIIDTIVKTDPDNTGFLTTLKISAATGYEDNATAIALLDTITYAGTLSMVRKAMQNNNTDEKIEEAAKDQWIRTLMLKSDIESKLGRHSEAIATLRRILILKPDDPMILNNLGYIMAINGDDLHEALDLVNRSLELEPDGYNTIDSKAWILYLLGQYDEALKTMERFFDVIHVPLGELIPDTTGDTQNADSTQDSETENVEHNLIRTLRLYDINPDAVTPVLTHLMAIYDALGQTDKATYLYEGTSELDPDNELVLEFKKKHIK